MSSKTRLRRESTPRMSAPQRWAHLRAVAKVAVLAIFVSELITIALMKVLVGDHVADGMLIALVCSGPLSAWITDREIRMNHLVARQRDQLSELNLELKARNDDLDAFSRAVAHDLKNPLTTIVGMAEILSSAPSIIADNETSDYVNLILESGDRAVEIIDGLLLLHGIQHEAQELVRTDVGPSVDIALTTLAGAATETKAVVTRPETFPQVVAHNPWLTQVWINLISNAIKYGGVSPTIDIAARRTADDRICFTVRDNGPGIHPTDRDRIFREFERGDEKDVEGHGLGLAIVSRAVTRMGGEVGVDDAPDGGSVFWFTVPAA